MGQQKHVYLVKDINVLGLNILSILMCFSFHMKITKGRQKTSPAKGKETQMTRCFPIIIIMEKVKYLHKYTNLKNHQLMGSCYHPYLFWNKTQMSIHV